MEYKCVHINGVNIRKSGDSFQPIVVSYSSYNLHTNKHGD